ncbi:hypothetical protein [Thermoproteus tenax]|uniref:Uncharacterized protein n=1 Tax=Thermoproteus tenax (strain ATCC 35583 / DSM 2078 / JCM 9277 / NBRC 100435 / Kra 1) TaxID=768679 RepID=G4RKP4_THETK|nr:hypothetical protein [Thermoproteus tenax]CCC82139.1 hypothetical protein TTX_1510 [Thermoproteus tenax Kra 1]
MRRDVLRGLLLGIATIAVAIFLALFPIEPLLSDEPMANVAPIGVLNGVVEKISNDVWFYLWKVTILLVIFFFAALVASFFVRMNGTMRSFFALISFAIAVFHYANFLTMANDIKIYPFFIVIPININGTIVNQYYVDIGLLFIIYGFYNVWKLFKE